MKYENRLVATVPACGQLGASEATLYTVPALARAARVRVVLSNIHATHTNTVSVYYRRYGETTSQRVGYFVLGPGEAAIGQLGPLAAGDMIRGMTTAPAEVDYLITCDQESDI
jgi:hypothetical protein